MKQPERLKNSPRWIPMLLAAVHAERWKIMPYDDRAYRSLMRARNRLGLQRKVAIVGRPNGRPPQLYVGPVSLARELRAGLRASDGGVG